MNHASIRPDQAADFQGTCDTDFTIARKFGIPEEDVVEAMLDHEIERCKGCAWWMETNELEDDGDVGFCEQCRPKKDDGE